MLSHAENCRVDCRIRNAPFHEIGDWTMRAAQLVLSMTVGMLCVLVGPDARASVITFDDLTTRNNFVGLGIASTYQGFHWGYSQNGGIAGAVVPSTVDTGWASATVANPAIFPAPTPVSGNSYAWNWNGPESLVVDFLTPHDVTGAYFATLSSAYGSNASTIQMFGYGPTDNLLATSGILNLTNSFQFLSANFSGVTELEIRANGPFSWFSVDNLEVSSASPTPEPATISLLAAGFLTAGGFGVVRRRRRTTDVP
jgi:hypothetical protein